MNPSPYPLSSLMEITDRPPLVFVRGEGSWLFDHEGKRYLDFVQGWGVNCLGHSPELIRRALADQAGKLLTPSPAYYNEPAARLAALLTEKSCLDRAFFANSGAEANEGAVKLARKWGAKHKRGAFEIITFANAFHGRTLAMMSASGKPAWATLFEPKVPGFPKAGLNDLRSVEALISERTVAVMLEPIQGEGGVIPASDDFLRELRTLTRERGLLLILDEVQTGMGRTGRLFAYEHAGVEPDIMTLGKCLGGGVPLAALLAKEEVCCFDHGDQGGTYCGNPLMAAVGQAIMETVVQPAFLENVVQQGEYLARGLRSLATRHGCGEVRGRGLLVALDLKRDLSAGVVREALAAGLLLNAPRPHLLRFMPALNVTREEIDEMLTLLDGALRGVPPA
jgi:acetylornithine/N-succinyldiaminopimelate aminotransferase